MNNQSEKEFIVIGIRPFISKNGTPLFEMALYDPETKEFLTHIVEQKVLEEAETMLNNLVVFIVEEKGMSNKVIGWRPSEKKWEIKIR